MEKIQVTKLKNKRKYPIIYEFPCHRWFGDDVDDKAIERYLVFNKIKYGTKEFEIDPSLKSIFLLF